MNNSVFKYIWSKLFEHIQISNYLFTSALILCLCVDELPNTVLFSTINQHSFDNLYIVQVSFYLQCLTFDCVMTQCMMWTILDELGRWPPRYTYTSLTLTLPPPLLNHQAAVWGKHSTHLPQ